MDEAEVKFVSCRTNNPSNGFDANHVFAYMAEKIVRATQGKRTSRIRVTPTIPTIPNRNSHCLVETNIGSYDWGDGDDVNDDDCETEMDEREEDEEEDENDGSRALYTSAPTMTALSETAKVPKESSEVRTEYNAPSSFTSKSGMTGHCGYGDDS